MCNTLQMYNSPSAGSMSPGGSPSAPGWANLQQPQQQADAQFHQQAQVLLGCIVHSQLCFTIPWTKAPPVELHSARAHSHIHCPQVQAALMQSAGLGGLSVGQLQAFLAAQDAGGGGGGLPRSASTSAVMQQQLGPQMNNRLAAALQAQVELPACALMLVLQPFVRSCWFPVILPLDPPTGCQVLSMGDSLADERASCDTQNPPRSRASLHSWRAGQGHGMRAAPTTRAAAAWAAAAAGAASPGGALSQPPPNAALHRSGCTLWTWTECSRVSDAVLHCTGSDTVSQAEQPSASFSCRVHIRFSVASLPRQAMTLARR
jgi:hypothetical protein